MSTDRPALTITLETRTLSWWRTRREKIDMDPPYQRRGRLWSPADKAYLIDSILNGFDVPKLYVADFSYSHSALNKKKLQYAIIDGKQRFEAIFDFFDGKITLNPDFTWLEDKSIQIGSLGYRDILRKHPEIAENFDNFNLAVMRVVTESEELINELFVRLNRSKPLTGAEIRNAMAGPAPEVIRQMAQHEFFAELISFPVSRGQDLNAAAKLLMFEYHDKPQETKKSSMDAFVRSTRDNREQLELATRRCHAMLNDLTTIFLPRDRLLSSAGLLPVYYWFTRGLGESNYHRIRDFLVQFEFRRKKNRQKQEDGAPQSQIDPELSEYDRFNRSTNDLASHNGRIGILLKRFREFDA